MRIPLAYGKTMIEFEFEPQKFEILGVEKALEPLSDHEIGERLDSPIGMNLETMVKPGETFLIVVPDATRNVGCGQIVNLLVRRLIANGTMPFDINIIFATGIHRKVTTREKQEILTPFIVQRIKTIDHDAKDLMQFTNFGETTGGIPIELNRNLAKFDHVIAIGGINFHYFAGFTGGRKLICPGLASSRTISETHKLAFDFEKKDRKNGVEVGRLSGNPVHQGFIEVVEKLPPTFLINAFVNNDGAIIDLFCGDWKESHEQACEVYRENHTIRIPEKRDVVIVSCGGNPYDLNMIQAHKALEMASHGCKDGGKIIFLAECENGLGHEDFIDWFGADNSAGIAERLCQNYQVNGQTAWSLSKKSENFDIEILTVLPFEQVEKMGLRKIESLERSFNNVRDLRGFIVPFGAKFKIETGD